LVADAQAIPFPDRHFGAVIANHMLYHVPDRAAALAEIHRVLRPGGRLYATTAGRRHLHELGELVRAFDSGRSMSDVYATEGFTLESGPTELARVFSRAEARRYEDMLSITEAKPLVEYVASGGDVSAEWQAGFLDWVQRKLSEADGVIRITKDSGLLLAQRSTET
jgi:SAM-dependent methyltransferase